MTPKVSNHDIANSPQLKLNVPDVGENSILVKFDCVDRDLMNGSVGFFCNCFSPSPSGPTKPSAGHSYIIIDFPNSLIPY